MLEFARSWPEHDLLFLRRDIAQSEEVDHWVREVGAGEIVTIFALEGDRIVGYSEVARSPVRWNNHLGALHVLVEESLRGNGLGRMLTMEAFRVAIAQGVSKIVAQMTVDQESAINVFRRLGFESEAILHNHVRDHSGKTFDVVLMRFDVSHFHPTLGPRATE